MLANKLMQHIKNGNMQVVSKKVIQAVMLWLFYFSTIY